MFDDIVNIGLFAFRRRRSRSFLNLELLYIIRQRYPQRTATPICVGQFIFSNAQRMRRGRKKGDFGIMRLLICAKVFLVFRVLAAAALIPRQLSLKNELKPSLRFGGMTMYFDDISRSKYTFSWGPSGDEFAGSRTVGGGGAPDETNHWEDSCMDAKVARDKAKALKKLLFGHDAESASALSEDDVKRETIEWARMAGLVGQNLNHCLYDDISGLHVCNSSSTLGCFAGFWAAVVDVINENTDLQGSWNIGGHEHSRLFMIQFPRCTDLYDYRTASILHSALSFCKESSKHCGKDFSVNTFHPKYKNAPKMIEPLRHSPFPSLGLHIPGEDELSTNREANRSRQTEKKPRKTRIPDDDFIPQLDERRRSLEKLFNSAAALTSHELTGNRREKVNVDPSATESVVKSTKSWMYKQGKEFALSKSAVQDDGLRVNRALQFSNTIDERWIVVHDGMAEIVYAEIWKAIVILSELGSQAKLLNTGKDDVPNRVLSTVFIAPNFCPYSASTFKKFAITVNSALKHFTGGKMFIELFHPEFVGSKEPNSYVRRSPFPTIQVCFRL